MDNKQGNTILIVEDDGTSRKLLRGILKTIGFKDIEAVESAEAALELLQAGRIGLVLVDWHLPGKSGLDFIKTLRADQAHQSVKVLMVTSESRQPNILEAIRAGVDGYIMKPYSKTNIQQKVEAVFAREATVTPDETPKPSSVPGPTEPAPTPASN